MIKQTNSDMPFRDHLEELRWRILWSVAAAVVGIALGFYLVLRFNALATLEQPILPYLNGHKLVATHPTDGLQITISAAMWIGVIVALPVVLYKAWLFLRPRFIRVNDACSSQRWAVDSVCLCSAQASHISSLFHSRCRGS